MKVSDLYTSITTEVIRQIESGTPPWTKPWKDSRVKGVGMIPSNLVTGRIYSGSNILILWMAAQLHGYSGLQFCTYNQVNGIGAKVKKGERAVHVIFTKHVLKKDEQSGEDRPGTVVKTYPVFHVSQLEGVPDKYFQEQQPLDLEEPPHKVRDFIHNAGVDVRFGFNQACYVPKEDYIKMPAFGVFEDEASFTGTLLHEVAHWTGHESRLNRTFGRRFADNAYAFEELVAELGSAFLCGRIGYQPSFRSASYVESWLKVLKADNRAIFSAASYAGHASDYVWKLGFPEDEQSEYKQAAE